MNLILYNSQINQFIIKSCLQSKVRIQSSNPNLFTLQKKMEINLPKKKTNQILQLKINDMLNRSMQKVNLLNEQYFIEYIQGHKANVYVIIDRVKGYIWPIQLQNASKVAVRVQNNRNQVALDRIITQGNSRVVIYKKEKDYQIRKSDEKVLQLKSKEQVIHISNYYRFDTTYMNVLITNFGNAFFVYSNSNAAGYQIKIQAAKFQPESKYKVLSNLTKNVIEAFSTNSRQYHYSYSDLFRVQQENNDHRHAYILLFKQLKVQMVFANYQIEYNSTEKCRYQKKWELDIQDCLIKANPNFRILLIWHMSMIKRVNDRVFILVGCNYQDSNHPNSPALLVVQIDCFQCQLQNVNKVDLEVQADYKLAQVVQFKGLVYVLARKIYFESDFSGKNQYSALIKVSVKDASLNKQTVQNYPFVCSLSSNEKQLFLLSYFDTFIIDQVKEQKMVEANNVMQQEQKLSSIASQNSYQQRHQPNQRHYQISQKVAKRIQTSLSRRDYSQIAELVEKNKQLLSNYIKKHKMEHSSKIEQIKDYEIQLLIQQLILSVLRNNFFDYQDIPDQIKNQQRIFTAPRIEDIQRLLLYIFQKKFMLRHSTYDYLISLIDNVLFHYSQESLNLKEFIKHKFGPIIQETLQILQETNTIIDASDYEHELLKKWVQLTEPSINDFRGMIHNRTAKLQQIMRSLKNQNLFILFYCETEILNNKDLAFFIRCYKQMVDQKSMHSFLEKLLDHYLQCVRVGTFTKKDLAIFQYLSPYDNFVYQFLKKKYSNIAWLVGLRLKIRDSQQIGKIGVTAFKTTENVDKTFTVVSDINNKTFEGDQVMVQICKYYGWQNYLCADEFSNLIYSKDQLIKQKKLPAYLWQRLKKTSLSQLDKEKLSQLQQNIALIKA